MYVSERFMGFGSDLEAGTLVQPNFCTEKNFENLRANLFQEIGRGWVPLSRLSPDCLPIYTGIGCITLPPMGTLNRKTLYFQGFRAVLPILLPIFSGSIRFSKGLRCDLRFAFEGLRLGPSK